MSHARVLIVHPDPSAIGLLTSMLQTLGPEIDQAPSDRAAMRTLEHTPAQVVLTAADPADADSLEFLSYVRRKYPQTVVLVLFTSDRPDRVREAQIRGAAAVLKLPIAAGVLRATVAQALGEVEAEPCRLPVLAPLGNGYHATPAPTAAPAPPSAPTNGPATPNATSSDGFNEELDLLGEDPAFLEAVRLARAVAPIGSPVMIVGERGLGKSLLAKVLHTQGPRPSGPFVEMSCEGLREAALDVALFGRKSSGYPEPDRPGKVDEAAGGTLFLDDVSALTPDLQMKLFRLLRDGESEPVGASSTVKADVRIVMGCREDLSPLMPDGRFRQELHARVGVVTLTVPPLRDRGGDVQKLAELFLRRAAGRLGKTVRGFAPEALSFLRGHSWSSNVLELESMVDRAVDACRGSRVEANHLTLSPRGGSSCPPSSRMSLARRPRSVADIRPLKEALEEPERELILDALEALDWNRQETARVLDINRTTLYKKMKKYGLLEHEPSWANTL